MMQTRKLGLRGATQLGLWHIPESSRACRRVRVRLGAWLGDVLCGLTLVLPGASESHIPRDGPALTMPCFIVLLQTQSP